MLARLGLLHLCLLAAACSTTTSQQQTPPCAAGEVRSCPGPNGCSGSQVCKPDNSGFSACECSDGGGQGAEGGTGGSGASGGSGGVAGTGGQDAGGQGNTGGSDAATAGTAGAAGAPGALVVTFGERPGVDHAGVTSDTRLSESEPTYNTGAAVSIGPDASPKRVVLFRFDLTALPVDTVVQSANLQLFTRACTGCEAAPGTSVQVYRLLEDWVEGTHVSAEGVANYTYRTATELWTAPGAGPGSRDTVSLASFSPQMLDTEYTIALPVNIVLAWVADPASNFGVELAIEGPIIDGVSFNSSESEFPEKRPLLALTLQ